MVGIPLKIPALNTTVIVFRCQQIAGCTRCGKIKRPPCLGAVLYFLIILLNHNSWYDDWSCLLSKHFGHFHFLERFDVVANLDIIEVFNVQTTFVSVFHFPDVFLEALQ